MSDKKVEKQIDAPLPPSGGKWKQDPKTGQLVKVEGTVIKAPVAKRDKK